MAAISPEKLNELMMKVRKGATSSFTLPQVQAIVEAIGGKVEPFIGFVKGIRRKDRNAVWADSAPEAAQKYEALKKLHVKPPAKPKPGVMYVTKLYEPVEVDLGNFEIEFESVTATEAVRVTMPDGKSETLLPNHHHIQEARDYLEDGPKKRPFYVPDLVRWLSKETDWVARVNEFLGVEEHVPADARTRDRTGSCPVCFQNVKLVPGKNAIVLHGYKRPGSGTVHGKCFGVGFQPFELSPDGTHEYLTKFIDPAVKGSEAKLASLKAGDVEVVKVWNREYRKGVDPGFEVHLKEAIEEADEKLRAIEMEQKAYQTLVQKWKERALPKEGDRHIDWFHEGRKASPRRVATAVLVAARFLRGGAGWEVVNPRSLSATELDQVWEAYLASYRKIGLTQSSLSAMMTEYDVWEVFYDQGQIRAFSVAKKTPFGIKSGLLGSDLSPEGKAAVKAYLSAVYRRPGRYSEVSHAVEHFALKSGAPVICSADAEEILKKRIEPLDDGIHYRRSLGGVGEVTKVMVGNPRGVPTTSATNPQCSIAEIPRTAGVWEEEPDSSCDLDSHYACQIDWEAE